MTRNRRLGFPRVKLSDEMMTIDLASYELPGSERSEGSQSLGPGQTHWPW